MIQLKKGGNQYDDSINNSICDNDSDNLYSVMVADFNGVFEW